MTFNTRRIFDPVIERTFGIPCESLNTTPICDGVFPFFAIFAISSFNSLDVVVHHEGVLLTYGSVRRAIPFPLL